MFKTIKNFISCFLVLCMMLSLAPMGVFATETSGSEETFNYVSIGDSMSNGYCFEGYNQGSGSLDFFSGNGVYGTASYPNAIADWLNETHGTVNHTKLAPSGMRAEDLLYLLGGCDFPADSWYSEVEYYTNCEDDASLSAHFIDAIEHADFITMCIGNASFGAFLLQHVTEAIGVMGATPSIDPDIVLENAISLLDEQQKEVVMEIYGELEEKLGAYISTEISERYNVSEVLDIVSYTAASFVISYAKCIERIIELNPDVEIMLIGLMNTTYGMTISGAGLEEPIPFGDIMDGAFGILNTYIAGLPAVMQATGKYEEAKFYYTEIDEIEFIVQKFDDLKNEDWATLGGLSGEIVRSRTIKSYNSTLRVLIEGVIGTLPPISLNDVELFEVQPWVGSSEDWATCFSVYGRTDSTELATSVAIYLAIEDALARSVDTMDIPYDGLMRIAGDLTSIFAEAPMVTTSPAGVREALGNYLSQDEFMPLCKIYSLFKIGDGMSVHPTPFAHAQLAEKIKTAYLDNHTAKDELIDNAVSFITEYYDVAYAEAYAKADEAGYVDAAAYAIDKAIEVVNALEIDAVEMTEEFKDLLDAELDEIVATLQEIKDVLSEDKANDVGGLVDSVATLGDDLFTHLTAASALFDQAQIDIKILVVPIIDAYINSLIEANKDLLPDITKDDIEAAIGGCIDGLDAEVAALLAKVGHNHYEAVEGSKYVAIGGNTVAGTAISYPNIPYYALVGEHYEIASQAVAAAGLTPGAALAFVETNKANIESADLITYQLDASFLVTALLGGETDWDKYIDAETKALVDEVLAQTKEVLETNWAEYAETKLEEIIPEIKVAVAENLPAEVPFVEGVFDAAADFVVPYLIEAARFTENKKAEAIEIIKAIDQATVDYAEKVAYAVVSYAIETKAVVEKIQEINPNATFVVVGMYNPARGLELIVGEDTIDAEEIFEYVIDATNLYYAALAVENKGFAFADVSDAETNGFNISLNVTGKGMDEIIATVAGFAMGGLDIVMHANAAGHEYIKNQIVAALTCDYSVYEQLDADNHTVKCSVCDFAKAEAHNFNSTTTCINCGYTQTVTPTPGLGSSGGGAVLNQFTIKFDTNGGRAIASVTVKKGEVLAKPTDPTKEGFKFDGWYTDKALTAKYDFSTPVTKAFTLYAKWIEETVADKLAKFTDIDKNAWYYDFVKTIIERGLMNGISETEFAPDATLTRGMFVTILHRIEGEPITENGANFTDVAEGQYYADAVKWANANGIVKGITETEFAPNAEITREQMAAMIARYANHKKLDASDEDDVTYTDSAEISEYAKEAVNTANNLGILIGNADGSFAPKNNATRAEAATLFARLLGVVKK